MSNIEKVIKEINKDRIQYAFNSLRQEDELYKVPFFLGDRFIAWYLEKNDLEDVQSEVEQWYNDNNTSLGLCAVERRELLVALKSVFNEMIDRRKELVEAAASTFKKAQVLQAPVSFSISTQYQMNFSTCTLVLPKAEKPAKNQKRDKDVVPVLAEVKGLSRIDRIAMMVKAPIRRNNGRVNVMKSSQAYDVGYKIAKRHLQFNEEQNVAI
jgi:hypothetical protein